MRIERTDAGYAMSLEGADVARFSAPALTGCEAPRVEIGESGAEGWRKVRLTWDVPAPAAQDELSIRFDLGFDPELWWAPHLAPEEGYVVGQHVFRAPALIVQRGDLTLVVVPDLDLVGLRPENPWFMDYDAERRALWLGMTRTEIPVHVLFKKAPGMTFEPGTAELGFFVAAYRDRAAVKNPWSRAAAFLWSRWGRPLLAKGEPVQAPLLHYVRRAYAWAFEGWGGHVVTVPHVEGVSTTGIVRRIRGPRGKGRSR